MDETTNKTSQYCPTFLYSKHDIPMLKVEGWRVCLVLLWRFLRHGPLFCSPLPKDSQDCLGVVDTPLGWLFCAESPAFGSRVFGSSLFGGSGERFNGGRLGTKNKLFRGSGFFIWKSSSRYCFSCAQNP